VNVEAFIKHTMLDDAVALLWSHRASAQRVPGGFLRTVSVVSSKAWFTRQTYTVTLDPFDDRLQVLLAVREILSDSLGVTVQEADLWWLARL